MTKKILIIDDATPIRQLVTMTLEGAKYEVCAAVDGIDALSKVVQFNPNMIICDVNMPNMGGIDFVKKIKTDPQFDTYKATPVVMLTTESGEQKKTQGQMAGAKAWMLKPFLPERLLAVVEKVVGLPA